MCILFLVLNMVESPLTSSRGDKLWVVLCKTKTKHSAIRYAFMEWPTIIYVELCNPKINYRQEFFYRQNITLITYLWKGKLFWHSLKDFSLAETSGNRLDAGFLLIYFALNKTVTRITVKDHLVLVLVNTPLTGKLNNKGGWK